MDGHLKFLDCNCYIRSASFLTAHDAVRLGETCKSFFKRCVELHMSMERSASIQTVLALFSSVHKRTGGPKWIPEASWARRFNLASIRLACCNDSDLLRLCSLTGSSLQCLHLRASDANRVSNIANLTVCNQLKVLNLGGLSELRGLQGLPPQLLELNINNCFALELEGTQIPLQQCTLLRKISARGCPNLTSVQFLEKAEHLHTADLSIGHFTDLSALSKCRRLTSLDLSYLPGPLTLGSVPSLTSLDLSYAKSVGVLLCFEALVGLQELSLRHCKAVESAAGLHHCTRLTALDLSHCYRLVDISALRSCRRLIEVNLSYCIKVGTIMPLAQCAQLAKIDAGYMQRALTPADLKHVCTSIAPSLTSLNLSCALLIKDVSFLASASSLTNLNLAGCKHIADVDAVLRRCKLLSCLNLRSSQAAKRV
jgi:hypothetical protein